VKLLDGKDKLIYTSIDDYKLKDQIFLMSCWPEALVNILSTETPRDEKLKLKIVGSGKVEQVLEFIADNFL